MPRRARDYRRYIYRATNPLFWWYMKPTGADIRAALDRWRLLLGLEDWTYTLQVGKMPGGDWGKAVVDVPYKKVHFRCWPAEMVRQGDTLDEWCSHEWSHVYGESLAAYALKLCKTDKQRDEVGDLEEALTTEISRTFQRLVRPR